MQHYVDVRGLPGVHVLGYDWRIIMAKKTTGVAGGDSEAVRIFERMEEERKRKAQAKEEANKPKKVTLPRLKFLDQK